MRMAIAETLCLTLFACVIAVLIQPESVKPNDLAPLEGHEIVFNYHRLGCTSKDALNDIADHPTIGFVEFASALLMKGERVSVRPGDNGILTDDGDSDSRLQGHSRSECRGDVV